MFERNDNQPPDERDRKYTECEWCNGSGKVYETIEDTLIKEDCELCSGSGQLEIED